MPGKKRIPSFDEDARAWLDAHGYPESTRPKDLPLYEFTQLLRHAFRESIGRRQDAIPEARHSDRPHPPQR
jgi:hypothetical protein